VTSGIDIGAAVLAGFQASFLAGIATGVGAIPVLFVRRLSARSEGIALSRAGGVMLDVIGNEIVPETRARGNETAASFALIAGFAAMILIAGGLG